MDRHHPTDRIIRFIIVALGAVCMLSFTDGQSTFRLQGYKSRCAGRVELSNGTRVCSDSWSLKEADPVCTQLNCGKPVGAGRSTFGSGSGERWVTVTRNGGITPLSTCSSRKDAGVVCAGGVRTPDVSTQPPDKVNWGGSINISCSISDQIHGLIRGMFLLTKMSVIQETKVNSISSVSFILPVVTFEDEGQYECCYDPKVSSQLCKAVPISVTVDLQAPNISVSSPDGQQRAGDGVQVTIGYRFVIVCSTSANNPEGQFFLKLAGSNRSVSEPAANHSASFHFPQSQYKHQGEYSCVYQVTGAGRNYTSPPSARVQVTVRQSLLPVIIPVAAVGLLLLLVVLIGVYFCHRRRRRRVSVTVTELAATTPSPTTANEYQEEEDDEEEADYVNVPPPAGDLEGGRQCDPSDDEADYENVEPSHNDDTLDIYGGDDSIYQNYEGSYRDDYNQKHAQ